MIRRIISLIVGAVVLVGCAPQSGAQAPQTEKYQELMREVGKVKYVYNDFNFYEKPERHFGLVLLELVGEKYKVVGVAVSDVGEYYLVVNVGRHDGLYVYENNYFDDSVSEDPRVIDERKWDEVRKIKVGMSRDEFFATSNSAVAKYASGSTIVYEVSVHGKPYGGFYFNHNRLYKISPYK